MTTHLAQVTDPATAALSYLTSADEHATTARLLRDVDTFASHKEAGRHREEERLCLKRAEILAAVAQAQSLEHLADSAQRIGLSL